MRARFAFGIKSLFTCLVFNSMLLAAFFVVFKSLLTGFHQWFDPFAAGQVAGLPEDIQLAVNNVLQWVGQLEQYLVLAIFGTGALITAVMWLFILAHGRRLEKVSLASNADTTAAGAAVTVLKAFFDENYVIPNPVVPSPDGLSLVPYTGPDAGQLTVGGELNKLAANIALGRNFAGIHWRTDYANSLRLGEAVATCVLQDQARTFNEDFGGFTFTGFDGTRVVIG